MRDVWDCCGVPAVALQLCFFFSGRDVRASRSACAAVHLIIAAALNLQVLSVGIVDGPWHAQQARHASSHEKLERLARTAAVKLTQSRSLHKLAVWQQGVSWCNLAAELATIATVRKLTWDAGTHLLSSATLAQCHSLELMQYTGAVAAALELQEDRAAEQLGGMEAEATIQDTATARAAASASDEQDLAALLQRLPLRRLLLLIPRCEDCPTLPMLASLEHLTLQANACERFPFRRVQLQPWMSSLPALVSVDIRGAQLQEASIFGTLAALTALTAVSLRDCVLSNYGRCSLSSFRGPSDENLLSPRTGEPAAAVGAALTCMPRLRKLDMAGTRLAAIDAATLVPCLRGATQLQELTVMLEASTVAIDAATTLS